MRGFDFAPAGAPPPRTLTLADVRLKMLGVDDLEPDYEAVMESGEALHDLFHEGDRWPDGLSKRDNMIDLAWHEKEFARGASFAWGLWRADGARYLGSAYLYPDPEVGPTRPLAAHGVHWIRTGEADDALRRDFKSAWETWARGLGFAQIRFSP